MKQFARLITKDLKKFERDLENANKKRIKAGEMATRVEGFRLMYLLREELEAGAPGGRAFSPLTEIARRMGDGGSRRGPLKGLIKRVRLNRHKEGDGFVMSIGFVDPGRGQKLSKSWKRIARRLQEGYTTPVTPELRKDILRQGLIKVAGKKRRRSQPWARYMFLKKTTTSLRTPARPIIDPFWDAHEREAAGNIGRNFEKKMAGERI